MVPLPNGLYKQLTLSCRVTNTNPKSTTRCWLNHTHFKKLEKKVKLDHETPNFRGETSENPPLVGGFNPSEQYARQIGFIFPKYIEMKIKKCWKFHHLDHPLDRSSTNGIPSDFSNRRCQRLWERNKNDNLRCARSNPWGFKGGKGRPVRKGWNIPWKSIPYRELQ